MNKKKWAREKSLWNLLCKLGEETGEVFKAALDEQVLREVDYREAMHKELDHVIFIAERLKEVLDV